MVRTLHATLYTTDILFLHGFSAFRVWLLLLACFLLLQEPYANRTLNKIVLDAPSPSFYPSFFPFPSTLSFNLLFSSLHRFQRFGIRDLLNLVSAYDLPGTSPFEARRIRIHDNSFVPLSLFFHYFAIVYLLLPYKPCISEYNSESLKFYHRLLRIFTTFLHINTTLENKVETINIPLQ